MSVKMFTFKIKALVAAAKTGSPALTICPNDTAPAPRASTEKAWAKAVNRPTGDNSFQLSKVRSGDLRTPVIH